MKKNSQRHRNPKNKKMKRQKKAKTSSTRYSDNSRAFDGSYRSFDGDYGFAMGAAMSVAAAGMLSSGTAMRRRNQVED
jgi:hypothetical protein